MAEQAFPVDPLHSVVMAKLATTSVDMQEARVVAQVALETCREEIRRQVERLEHVGWREVQFTETPVLNASDVLDLIEGRML